MPLSKVNAEMTQSTLASAQFEAYQTQLQSWLAEVEVQYYPERVLGEE